MATKIVTSKKTNSAVFIQDFPKMKIVKVMTESGVDNATRSRTAVAFEVAEIREIVKALTAAADAVEKHNR